MQPNPSLVIVGRGLAGTTALIHTLLKIANDPDITAQTPATIQIIERYPEQENGGIAYGKVPEFEEHRLNLSSRSVPIFKIDSIPEGFPTFPLYLKGLADAAPDEATRDAYLEALQNPPRMLFGEYLGHIAELAKAKAGDKVKLIETSAEVTALDVEDRPHKITIQEGNVTRQIETDNLVLATGFKETLRAPFLEKVLDSPRYLDNNYSAEGNDFYRQIMAEQKTHPAPTKQHVLVIGTGLSADDAVIRLLQSGYQGKITMLSRNGLEHAGYSQACSAEEYLQTGLPGEARPEKVRELEKRPPYFMQIVDNARAAHEATGQYDLTAERNILQTMKREFSVLIHRNKYTPEEVLGYWERFVPDIAEALEADACRRLYDQHATWLTTHRIGTTPKNTRILEEAKKSGQLQIVAGYITTRSDQKPYDKDGKIHVTYTHAVRVGRAENPAALEPRDWFSFEGGNGQPVTIAVDRLISGMGYRLEFDDGKGNIRQDLPPMWNSLAQAGALDWHRPSGEGVAVDKDFTLLNQKGERVEGVAVVGVPVSGAIMFSRLPYIEKPGRSGGRLPPFQANVVGTVTAVHHMVETMYERMKQSVLKQAEAWPELGNEVDPATAAQAPVVQTRTRASASL